MSTWFLDSELSTCFMTITAEPHSEHKCTIVMYNSVHNRYVTLLNFLGHKRISMIKVIYQDVFSVESINSTLLGFTKWSYRSGKDTVGSKCRCKLCAQSKHL